MTFVTAYWLYLLCGLPWTIYAMTRQVRLHGAGSPFRCFLCVVGNVLFWPVAPIVAAVKGL